MGFVVSKVSFFHRFPGFTGFLVSRVSLFHSWVSWFHSFTHEFRGFTGFMHRLCGFAGFEVS